MRKFYLFLLLLFAAFNVNAQSGMSVSDANLMIMPGVSATGDELEWMRYFNPSAQIGSISVTPGTEAGGAVRFSKDFLSEHVGKKITAVAVGLRFNLDSLTLFVKKGDKISEAEVVYSQKVEGLQEGWNYIKLDQALKIEADVTLNIEYRGIVNSPCIGIEANAIASKGCSYLYSNNSYMDLSDVFFGNILIGALISENVDILENAVALNDVTGIPDMAIKNATLGTELFMKNNSYSTISSITVVSHIDGIQNTEEIKFSPAIEKFSKFSCEFPIEISDEDSDISFVISHVNGKENIVQDTIVRSIRVFDENELSGRGLLIEGFTRQDGKGCSAGEKYIRTITAGLDNYIIRLNHHLSGETDCFAIENSELLGNFFETKSVPQYLINRTQLPGKSDVLLAPDKQLNTGTLLGELKKNPGVSINIGTSYDKQTRELTVRVKGKGDIDLTEKRINVILTQSGYKAYQHGETADYVHNDFPVVFLTEYNGNALVSESDGTYDMVFKCIIPESLTNDAGTIKIDIEQLKVIAFISDWNKRRSSEVVNTACVEFDPETDTGKQDVAETVLFYICDGKVVCNQNCSSIEVYDLCGMRLENRGIQPGIYVVKAIVQGEYFIYKLIVE